MTAVPRSPQRSRLSPAVRGVLVWCASVLAVFALVLLLTLAWPSDMIATMALKVFAVVLPAGLLRHWPLPGLALVLAGFLLSGPNGDWDPLTLQLVVLHVVVGYIAATRRPVLSLPAAALVFAVEMTVGHLGLAPNRSVVDSVITPVFLLLTCASVWVVGNSVRLRRKYGEALRERAVADERLRIARELHDMISHSIGVIAIQAGVGGRVIETQPAEARNALATIEATSRETLAQLRRTLGSLRRSGAVPAEFDPAPGLADLGALVDSTRAAGVDVELRLVGKPAPVPADIDLSAYRIIQEALTNVVRHAGTGRCRVTVEHGNRELRIEITDDGRGTSTASAGAGFGIAGMRERVAMLHGEFSAGPRPEGGFGVSARLLLPS
ncbi:sensor histidine kinase [Phytomonospora sp. NPDC050363]|uniref:sensor histidine kinase n=1 Tax=Phytomonospora sp. NPDC050363 TaxID=3155642 RepID=UPI0033F990DF